MNFLSTKEIAKKWGLSDRRVRMLCSQKQIVGAVLDNKNWKIPENTIRPQRKNSQKKVGQAFDFEKIDKLKQELQACRPLTQGEVKKLNEDFLVNFTYNSNAIEGNTLTLNETNMVLQGITIDKKPLKDHMEAIGHKEAFFYVLDLVKDKIPLDETLIKKLHSLILIDQPQDKGVYRSISVMITGSSHTPPQPYLIPQMMEDLILDYKKWEKEKHIIETVALFHLNFERIHPFIDRNGRTGRLLLNLMLMENGLLPINIKFANRKKYYDCFEQFNKTKKPKAMIELIKSIEEEQLKFYISIVKNK